MMMRKLILCIVILSALFADKVSAQVDKNYFYSVGRNFIIDNKYQDAIGTLNVLLRYDQNAYEAYFLRGVAKYNLDDLVGAVLDFSMAIEKNPVYTYAFIYRGITRAMMGNYDDALNDFQEAIDLRPDITDTYYSRGITYLNTQQPRKAIEDFDHFIRRESKVSDAYISRGTAYLSLKDTLGALNNFNEAIKVNNENADAYSRRAVLYLDQSKYDQALADFGKAINFDPASPQNYFNRAILYSKTNKPVAAISDLDKVLSIDSTSSVTYFNRAIIRGQIGDYNRALDDYNRVAVLSPNNVLLYYNRAILHTQLGDLTAAINDYSHAINLYPDFSNAYLGRSSIRYFLGDDKGSQSDSRMAKEKIAEYRAKLMDNSFSAYADTSQRFNQLLSFDAKLEDKRLLNKDNPIGENLTLLPMYSFSLIAGASADLPQYYAPQIEDFINQIGNSNLRLTNGETNLTPDSLMILDARLSERIKSEGTTWQLLFERGVSQSLIRQYSNSIALYTAAIDLEPSNPLLYINRSTIRSEMTDFISSLDNSSSRLTIDRDPASRLITNFSRTYNYDDAISDLNKATKLMPDFAYAYYNRGNLYCRSWDMSQALIDYSQAIELNPWFGEAYYNRGLVQIFLKETQKGLLDLSKAAELGVAKAYEAMKYYGASSGSTGSRK